MDLSTWIAPEIQEEHIAYIEWALRNEGNTVFLEHLDKERLNLAKDAIEFAVYEPKLSNGNSGLHINVRCETSLPGLYAAGDAIGGVKRSVCPGALTLGWLAGENAAIRSRSTHNATINLSESAAVKQRQEMITEWTNRSAGAIWQEAQLAVQNIMNDYCGLVRSASMLKAGLAHISKLRDRMHQEVYATNPHEVNRVCEVFNLADIGEVVMVAALSRTESRLKPGYHFRADYPQPDDKNWRKFLAVKHEGARLTTNPVSF